MTNPGDTDVGKLKIHFFYVALILGLVIVVLVSARWTKVDGFIDYLNVAAGVTSIALGILAIIYSFVSTGAFNRSLGAIEDSATQVARTATELAGVLQSGQALQTRVEGRTDELHNLVADMRGGVMELGAGLKELAATTSHIAGSVDAIPDRISASQQQATPAGEAPAAPQADTARVVSYLQRCSLSGVLLLYALTKAAAQGKYLELDNLYAGNGDYFWGFLVGAIAAGFIEVDEKSVEGRGRIVRLEDPSADFIKAIEDEWKRRKGKAKNKHSTNLFERYPDDAIDKFIVSDEPTDAVDAE